MARHGRSMFDLIFKVIYETTLYMAIHWKSIPKVYQHKSVKLGKNALNINADNSFVVVLDCHEIKFFARRIVF